MVLEKKVLLERMTWQEVEEAVKESKGIVMIPIGATEQHGPALSLDVDTISTVEVAIRTAKKTKVVVAPTIPVGVSMQNMDFPGTLTVRSEILKEYVKDIAYSLAHHGFDKILLLNGHGGNIPALDIAAEEIDFGQYGKSDIFCCHVKVWELASVPGPKEDKPYNGHGGSQEASLLWALRPEDVYTDKFVDSKPETYLGKGGCIWPPQNWPYNDPIHVMIMASEAVEYGHFGDPQYGSRERGEKVYEAWTNALVEFVQALKNGELKWRKMR